MTKDDKERGASAPIGAADDKPSRQIAKNMGMGHNTYTKCKYVDKHGTEEQKKSLNAGKTSLDNIYKKISEEKRIEAQDGRRNITKFKYTEKEIRRNFLKERNEAKKRQGARNDLKTSIKTEGQGARVDLLPKDLKGLNNIAHNYGRSDEDRSDRTDRKLAEKAGVGHDTIHKTRYVMEKADKELLEQMRSGETSLSMKST